MKHHTVLHVVAKLLIPYIVVFALYVQFHGEYGAGGGFQAGVIFGAAFILYSLIFGKDYGMKVAPESLVQTLAAGGVLLYTGVGVAGMLLGGNFLDYSVLSDNPVAGQHLGILLIEMGVGLTVAAVMICLFFCYANYRHDRPPAARSKTEETDIAVD